MHGLTRRQLLYSAAMASGSAVAAEPAVVGVGPGPHLFLDDFLIESREGLERVVHPPVRHAGPVLERARFGVTQPYLSVLHDPDTRRFRMWYNHGPAVWHAVSADGVRWDDPRAAWDIPRGYGVTVIDDRGRDPDAARRYKLANWQSNREWDDTPRDNGGVFVGFSPDGLRWSPHPENPVLRTYPAGWPLIEKHGVGDTIDAFYDPIRGRYAAAVKVHALPEDGYAPAPKAGRIFRRLVGMTTSADFVRWEKPWRILVPDGRDAGLLEFYGMGGVHAVGPLLVGLARVLRDDLPCDPGGPNDGVGYTVLTWSRDGVRWERDRVPYLDRNPEPKTWDHAMAWGSAMMPVGDETFLYYGGYARGHKIEAQKERQVGLARCPKERYVALRARDNGRLRMRVMNIPGGRLLVNLAAKEGHVRARLFDPAHGRPYPGFDWSGPVGGDGRRRELRWKRGLASLRGRPAAIEWRLSKADLFAFEFAGGDGAEGSSCE